MRQIGNISAFLSSGLNPAFASVKSIELAAHPLGGGAFGEVIDCISINGNCLAEPQVIKLLTDDGAGIAAKGFETIQKLQQKIAVKHTSLLAGNNSLDRIPALHALPQFSFRGEMNGKRVMGYSAARLDVLGYAELDAILDDRNLVSAYHRLSLEEKLALAFQLAEGIDVLQQLSYIHADINPKNIFVNIAERKLAIIDFDSGAVTAHAGDKPTTFGKPCDGEWQAFEILRQLKKQTGLQTVKVDFFTDLWSVAIGIHNLVFLGGPLFYLSEISENSLSDYFYKWQLKWPDISLKSKYVKRGIQQQHANYTRLLQSPQFQPVCSRLAHSINIGLLKPNVRTSCRQWMHTIEPCLSAPAKAVTRGLLKAPAKAHKQNVTYSYLPVKQQVAPQIVRAPTVFTPPRAPIPTQTVAPTQKRRTYTWLWVLLASVTAAKIIATLSDNFQQSQTGSSPNTTSTFGINAVNGYPPTGFVEDDPAIEAPGGHFRLEQWNNRNSGPLNVSLYQTWLVPQIGNPVRLPEARLHTRGVEGHDSSSIGYSSNFYFSPDGKYLFREQKIFRGANAAYLYRHAAGLNYEVLVPDLYVRASNFFTQKTGLKWENGTGIVEFSAWEPDMRLVLTLRGYSEGRKASIGGWRCVFSPSNSQFGVQAVGANTNPTLQAPQALQTDLPVANTTLFYTSHAADNNIYFGKNDGLTGECVVDSKQFEARGNGHFHGTESYTIRSLGGSKWQITIAGNSAGTLQNFVFWVNNTNFNASDNQAAIEARGNIYDKDGHEMWHDDEKSMEFTFRQGDHLPGLVTSTPAKTEDGRIISRHEGPLNANTSKAVSGSKSSDIASGFRSWAIPEDPPKLIKSFSSPLQLTTPTSPQPRLPGELHPETRIRLLSQEEIRNWDDGKLRYAINEVYARHGADFSDKSIAKYFGAFSWYHRRPHFSYEQAEAEFTFVETENMKLLGRIREERRSGQRNTINSTVAPGSVVPTFSSADGASGFVTQKQQTPAPVPSANGLRYQGKGTIYKVPDLKKLVGKNLDNAWIYGDLIFRGAKGNIGYFHTSAMLLLPGEGSTQFQIEFSGGIQLSQAALNILQDPVMVMPVKYGAKDPLQLLAVSRDSNGNLVVRARSWGAFRL